jgi:hypothetical protein
LSLEPADRRHRRQVSLPAPSDKEIKTMKSTKRFQALVILTALLWASTVSGKDVPLGLKTTFIDQVKNKATINTNLKIDAHPNSPHSIKSSGNDGDIHMAGRDSVFLLPLVVEIINARLEAAAMRLLKESSPDQPLNISGVWRIWFEHVGKTKEQMQGKKVPVPANSNPDHVCEIHPVTRFGNVDVLDSFVEIKGYEAYPASKTFPYYDDIDATIKASSSGITISSGQSKYNYTEFMITLAGKPKDVGDGFIVLAQVFDTENDEEPVIPDDRRMIFVKGTPPADKLLKMKKGDELHVLGIPRVNLAEVAALASKHGNKPFETKLPYEMIIVAILPD